MKFLELLSFLASPNLQMLFTRSVKSLKTRSGPINSYGQEKKKKKEETLFYSFTGGWTFEVGSVGRSGYFFKYFSLPGGKNDSPKNTIIAKKIWRFFEKNFGKVLPKNSSQIFFDFGQKTADLT